MVIATGYWSAILSPGAAMTEPIRFAVDTDDDNNASAGSLPIDDGPYAGMTRLAATIIHGASFEWPAYMTLGWDWCANAYTGPISVTPRTGGATNLTSTIAHEIGHALGILSSVEQDDLGNNRFDTTLTTWDSYLVDSFGNPAKAGDPITESWMHQSGYFTLRLNGHAFFQGPEVLRVLGNAIFDPYGVVRGLPVNGFEGTEAELSHVELKNSMMSHQS